MIGICLSDHQAVDVAIPAVVGAVIAVELPPGRAAVRAAEKPALLDRDIDRNVQDIRGSTAMHLAWGTCGEARKSPFVLARHSAEG